MREGLDLPEVSLVAILDADKEGFLRRPAALIQTMGRAARHVEGRAMLYADVMTDSMRRAIDETTRRRQVQMQYNEANGITPQSIIKAIDHSLVAIAEADYLTIPLESEADTEGMNAEQRSQYIVELEERMREAAKKFEFEHAEFRDRIKALKSPDVSCTTFALAGAGRVSASFVSRLPHLRSELGPVAAQSYRLASRIVNSIGAGNAVRGYQDLNDSRLILICAPVRGVGAMVSALGESLTCRGKIFLLCESGCDSRKLAGLRAQGAAVAPWN